MKSCKKRHHPLSESLCPGIMVGVCKKKCKCHPALMSYSCDISEKKDMSDVKRGTTMYPCIRCLPSNHDIRDSNVGPTRIAHEMDVVLKSYMHHNTSYAEQTETEKRREARPN